MEFEGLRRSSHTPNLTPLIDIVFLLLVFFMLTAHFVKDESIAIELPEAESGGELKEDEVVEVVVDGQGTILIKGEQVVIDALESQLKALLQGRENKWVTLRGDRGVALETTVAILDAARNAGAASVDIVTNKP